jgi:RNA-binding protein
MKRPATLTSKQRQQLRGLAHHLEPTVQIGSDGVSQGVIDAVDRALTDHELVKVRVLESCPVDRKSIAPLLADPNDAHAVGVVGRIVILYRRHPEKPKVPLRS